MFLKTVNTTENIFDLPKLQVHLNISSVAGLKNNLNSLEAQSSQLKSLKPHPYAALLITPKVVKMNSDFSELFTKILKKVRQDLAVDVPDFALADPYWEGRIRTRVVKLPIYCRSSGTQKFYMIVDLEKDRIGFWDTALTGADLNLGEWAD